MAQKFIVTTSGVLRFGNVSFHKDLLEWDEDCLGGGFWQVDEGTRSILLFGRSYDFGAPDFDGVRRIEWGPLMPLPLLYLPDYPDRDTARAITADTKAI